MPEDNQLHHPVAAASGGEYSCPILQQLRVPDRYIARYIFADNSFIFSLFRETMFLTLSQLM